MSFIHTVQPRIQIHVDELLHLIVKSNVHTFLVIYIAYSIIKMYNLLKI